MIKAIIFDHFGVLVDSVYDTLYADLPDKDRQLARSIGAAADRGEITNTERDEQIMPFLGGSRAMIEAAHARARRNDELLPFILELRRNYKVSMLSNAAGGLVESFFSPSDMETYFDDVVLSYNVRLIKPDKEIYRLAAERLGVMSHECVFVDDASRNTMGAEAAGMHGIVYRDVLTLKSDLAKVIEDEHARIARS